MPEGSGPKKERRHVEVFYRSEGASVKGQSVTRYPDTEALRVEPASFGPYGAG